MHSDPCEWHHTEPLTCSAMLQLPNKGREEEDCRHVNTDVKNAGFTGEDFQSLFGSKTLMMHRRGSHLVNEAERGNLAAMQEVDVDDLQLL